MRATLMLEPAVAERINRLMAARGESMKEVVNNALREGLKIIEHAPAGNPTQFIVKAHDFGVRGGRDLDTIGRLADDLEDEATDTHLHRGKRA